MKIAEAALLGEIGDTHTHTCRDDAGSLWNVFRLLLVFDQGRTRVDRDLGG